jgi:type IV pilus assembly protein PilO
MEISLTKLPWYAQIGAFLLLAVAGAGVFYYYEEMPARADMEIRAAQLKAMKVDIQKGLATASQLDKFKADVDGLESRLESLRAVLPEEKDAADLLRRMQTVATQSNLQIKTFTPGATVTKQLHAEWPIKLELEGTYHNLATFFDRVGKFTRIVNITGLEVKGRDKPNANATISATCVATTFVLLDKPAPPKGRGAAPGAPAAAPAKKS